MTNDMVMNMEETVMIREGGILNFIAEKARKIKEYIENAFRAILKPVIA